MFCKGFAFLRDPNASKMLQSDQTALQTLWREWRRSSSFVWLSYLFTCVQNQYLCLNLLSASLNCILPRLDPGAFENFNELVLQITQKERCRSIACLRRLKLISLWQHNSWIIIKQICCVCHWQSCFIGLIRISITLKSEGLINLITNV